MDIGQVLDGRYRLRERLGVGGTSTVFRAEDAELGRDVAVKVFGPESEVSDSDRRRREARLLASLRHPAIVALFDAKLGGEPPYLVLEYVRGTTLAERIRRGPLSRGEAREIGAAAASGLAVAHAAGIVHRDVKPANLVVVDGDPHAAARLLDFGIAHSRDVSRHTRTGSVLGSALYLSPEQARGHELTPASDVYSLGLVLIECLTGRPAFPGDGLDAVAARLTTPPALDDPVLAAEAALLARMTALEPRDRPTAEEVARELASPAATAPLVAPAPAPTHAIVPGPTSAAPAIDVDPIVTDDVARPRRRASALVGAGAAALIALAGGAVLLLDPGSAGPLTTDDAPAKVMVPVDAPAEDDPAVEGPPADDAVPATDPGGSAGDGGPGNGNGNPGNGNGNPGNGNGNPGNGDRGNGNGPPGRG